MAVAFSSDEQNALHREVDSKSDKTCSADLPHVYELDQCEKWITDNQYKEVCVQFADAQLSDSVGVVQYLQKNTGANVYILADTSYGSCCADAVAAEHISADCLIHFGHSCGSATSGLPTLYINTRQHMDVTAATTTISLYIQDNVMKGVNGKLHITLENDPIYNHIIDELCNAIEVEGECAKVCKSNATKCAVDNGCELCAGQRYGCSDSDVTIVSDSDVITEHVLVYISARGCDSQAALACRMKYIGNATYTSLLLYDCQSNKVEELRDNHKLLMKRYHMVERIRDASVIGILVGTLGVTDYLSIIDHLKLLIRDSGKKSYLFSVGKLNPAKLANFSNVDVYVVVGCTETSLYLDSRQDYYRPLVTPYELELALNKVREWRAAYSLDFRQLLPGGADHMSHVTDDSEIASGDSTDVSLITGRIRQLGKPSTTDAAAGGDKAKQLVLADTESGGGATTWSGLQINYGKGEIEEARVGQTGTPTSYHGEPAT